MAYPRLKAFEFPVRPVRPRIRQCRLPQVAAIERLERRVNLTATLAEGIDVPIDEVDVDSEEPSLELFETDVESWFIDEFTVAPDVQTFDPDRFLYEHLFYGDEYTDLVPEAGLDEFEEFDPWLDASAADFEWWLEDYEIVDVSATDDWIEVTDFEWSVTEESTFAADEFFADEFFVDPDSPIFEILNGIYSQVDLLNEQVVDGQSDWVALVATELDSESIAVVATSIDGWSQMTFDSIPPELEIDPAFEPGPDDEIVTSYAFDINEDQSVYVDVIYDPLNNEFWLTEEWVWFDAESPDTELFPEIAFEEPTVLPADDVVVPDSSPIADPAVDEVFSGIGSLTPFEDDGTSSVESEPLESIADGDEESIEALEDQIADIILGQRDVAVDDSRGAPNSVLALATAADADHIPWPSEAAQDADRAQRSHTPTATADRGADDEKSTPSRQSVGRTEEQVRTVLSGPTPIIAAAATPVSVNGRLVVQFGAGDWFPSERLRLSSDLVATVAEVPGVTFGELLKQTFESDRIGAADDGSPIDGRTTLVIGSMMLTTAWSVRESRLRSQRKRQPVPIY